MSSERRYFWSDVTDTDPRDPRLSPEIQIPRCADTKIALSYYKISGRSWINAPPDAIVFNAQKLVARTLVYAILSAVKNSSKRGHYTTLMAKLLSKFGVPRHEQQALLEKIFGVIDVMVPGSHIIVLVGDVTVQTLHSASNLDVGDVTLPLWINGRFIDDKKFTDNQHIMHHWDLEKVALDSLEAAVRQMPCTICMDDLDHVDAAEEGNDHQRIIARLPCSHIYHEGCIVLWLETNHICPLCRSPAVKASKSSLRLHWPTLMMSAVGVLTATLIPRLFNRNQR
ncbi:PREDICTED: probable E3 ubiquitin-protein ligase HIP1 [Fragaria vesca subsp. vesca]|uniref:probable E3 ubiquitin-protein ligase HIP1 n=1 Tax=Fragaria vesca subsp. vesca TaxID=101020 RepID=UPI0002C2FE00|nr:PREDICTED: probable E3 ubiquitin-protein ligase HIP1 [Fragaria vesca subsp. vesca]XP_011464000.1 PREDICTED: probable E3 ubiquitin-protein ligase HIP1 [Fragaria vesca subsp. vesca]